MNINLKIWRQKTDRDKGAFKTYKLQNIDPNISFLEMLDILNNRLIKEKLGWEPNWALRKGMELTYRWIAEQVEKFTVNVK